jgi:hypothetical protein
MNQVTTLLELLSSEIKSEKRQEMTKFIGDLYTYVHTRDPNDPDDLSAKLKAANRDKELLIAPAALEQFDMLLETYQHFPSGQKLLGLFLANIHDVFCYQIVNRGLSDDKIDEIIQTKIIDQTIVDIGLGFEHFTLSKRQVRGMIYFLADKCFVRWDDKCSV